MKKSINVSKGTDIRKFHRLLKRELNLDYYYDDIDTLCEALTCFERTPLYLDIYGCNLLSDEMQDYISKFEILFDELENYDVHATLINQFAEGLSV